MINVKAKLQNDGSYTRIAKIERDTEKGGLFEVYHSNIQDNTKKQSKVKSLINEGILFAVAGRTDLNAPILKNKPPKRSEFEEQNYLIREKNTLRFANIKEVKKLAEAELQRDNDIDCQVRNLNNIDLNDENKTYHSDHILENSAKKIMQDSYGRSVMAYHRARGRYDDLVEQYNNIFSFKFIKEDIKVGLYDKDTKDDNLEDYNSYYVLTLKDKCKHLTLKKVLEVLQVYNSCNTNPDTNHKIKKNIKDRRINGSTPILVNLNIGRSSVEFMLSRDKNQDRQLTVSMKNQNGKFIGNSYSYWLGIDSNGIPSDKFGFCSYNFSKQRMLAQFIINCLDSPLNNQPLGFNDYTNVKKNIVEFIATTQIAEANHDDDYNGSRTLGMNKLARARLRKIAQGTITFEQAFDPLQLSELSSYPPIGTGGTSKAREAVSNITRERAMCSDMSDDSEDETV